jgi:hypothetical protein
MRSAEARPEPRSVGAGHDLRRARTDPERKRETDMRAWFWILPAALLLPACTQSGTQGEQVCTLVGCESGLEVAVQPAPSGAYSVEVEAAGQATRTVQCTAGSPCALFFRDFTPERATVRVIVAGDTTTAAVAPEYRTLQPNGPQCPPTCRRASVTVDLNADG